MLKLTILTPERRLIEKASALEVTLQGSEGQIQILPGYAPMIGTLESGFFQAVLADGSKHKGFISSGFFSVANDIVTVTADTLELAGEINLERARQAQKRAEEALNSAALEPDKFRKYELKLQRALIRQQVSAD